MALEAVIKELGGSAPKARVPVPTMEVSPAEEAEADADVRSPESRRALEQELARKDIHPAARRILQQEFDRNFGPSAQPPSAQPAANDDALTGVIDALSKVPAKPRDLTIPAAPGEETEEEKKQPPSTLERIKTALGAGPVGPIEAGASMVTGALGSIAGAVGGIVKGFTGGKYGTPEGALEAQAKAAEIQQALTYEPRTEAGQETLSLLGKAAEQTGANKLVGLGPSEAMALSGALAAPQVAARVPKTSIVAAETGGGRASVGAAGTTLKAQANAIAATASPEIQKVASSIKEWTPNKVATLERYVDADTLPVKMNLMTGQATDNPTLMSKQFNAKGVNPQTAEMLKTQNKHLIENLTTMGETAAPDVYVRTPGALGETVIDAYKRKLGKMSGETTAAYKALEDANGGAFPMDAKAFVNAADEALKKKLKSDFVPGPLKRQLSRFRNGEPMNFEQFEAMRTNLANIARSQADGNVKQAAAIIRNSLEEMPMAPGAEKLKGLADKARAASKAEHAAIDADPAMRAVAKGKALPDGFIDKHVLKGDTSKVNLMVDALKDDPQAAQAVAAHLVERLKSAARIVDNNGVFNQAGYNKLLQELRPKLEKILPPQQLADLEKLGRVARVVKGQDAGTFFNNSNSWIAALSDIGKDAVTSAIPGGRVVREIAGNIRARREFSKSMQTGAGLKLKEVGR